MTTATEAKNRFGYYCSQAKTEAVIVEKDGRPDTVMLDYVEYKALLARAGGIDDAKRQKEFNEQYGDWIAAQNADLEKNGLWSDGLIDWQR
ncbi:prevent-host-death protein [Ramlibacter sp.]|uniref:prevent-host-death protein n=1 Tax=Ramlibacter sp. TaxID=1917967 RepID=UPI003D09CEA9